METLETALNENGNQVVCEMVGIATDKRFRENRKEKHSGDAFNGWYYYTTRFAMPIYDNDVKTEKYNIYSGRLVVNTTGQKICQSFFRLC